jgi:PIN domain nuclease of toxin-antitoxin system
MKLLLDTHTFLWLVEGSPNLSLAAQTALADSANDLFLSVASVWELAIKTGNKKLTLRDPLAVFVAKWTATYKLHLLPIQAAIGDSGSLSS